ncbi:RmlC-like cupins superfamily protein [Euphorbia peplus]|nr:RmlC-like cupins superfamily protein [Euphorbia peplus]
MAPILILFFFATVYGGVSVSGPRPGIVLQHLHKMHNNMEITELSPKTEQLIFDGEGGSYSVWSASEFAETNVGGGKLVLHPHGFALPHYADSSKIGFVLQGTLGNFAGFSSNFISRAYNLNEEEAIKLATSQTASLIIKLDSGISMPNPDIDLVRKYVYSVQNAEAEVKVKNGGIVKSVSEDKFPFIGEVGLSVVHVKLYQNATFSPSYTTNGDAKLVYIVKGSGDVEMVGINGMQVLNAKLESGNLFLVPRFFSFGLIAADYGLQFLSISTSSRPVIEELATKTSVWNAISPIVSQVSLNITPQLEQLFKSNMKSIIVPPTEH